MCPYKSDEDISHPELYHNDQPVLIPFYIKYITLIPHIIYRREIGLDVLQIRPLCFFHYLIPTLQCHFCIFPSPTLIKLPELSVRHYPHIRFFCKDMKPFWISKFFI